MFHFQILKGDKEDGNKRSGIYYGHPEKSFITLYNIHIRIGKRKKKNFS